MSCICKLLFQKKKYLAALTVLWLAGAAPLHADETCLSPYMAKIVGQEDYVYVWTLGVDGLGDGQDKIVTIDVNPQSESYGEILHVLQLEGRNEAHHAGLTDDRRYLWAGGLDSNKIFIIDIHTDPAKPRLYKVIDDFVEESGGVTGPHTFYALPGRMLITGLSNSRDHGGYTGMVEYTNSGEYVTTHWMPSADNLQGAEQTGEYADGYGYDVRALPRRNVMVNSSFTGYDNYMRDLGELLNDAEAMKNFGNTMVLWNLHTRQPKKIFDVPGAPLEIRCAWGARNNYCFTTAALTSKIWLIYEDESGEWQADAVADVGNPAETPLPTDISISANDTRLWVNTWNDGKTRLFDITDPHNPKQIYEKQVGAQINMVSQSWDGERVYYTSSLLSKWDKTEGSPGDVQYFKAYRFNGNELIEAFSIDFIARELGWPHIMRFGDRELYAATPVSGNLTTAARP